MEFEVRLTEAAKLDLFEVLEYIAKDWERNSSKWYQEFLIAASMLSEMPERFPKVPESDSMRVDYRSFNHYSHRVIYRVDTLEKIVFIVRIYHEARRPLNQTDLQD